jgi:hypothetical protein
MRRSLLGSRPEEGRRRCLLTLLPSDPAWTPASLPNQALWLKGDAGTWQDNALSTAAAAHNDPVGGWVDQFGVGNNLLQGTSSRRPLLQTGVNGINGRAALLSDGVDDRLTALFTLNQPFTVLMVVQAVSVPLNANWTDGGIASTTQFYSSGATNSIRMFAGSGSGIAGAALGTAAPHLVYGLFNGGSSAMQIDNQAVVTGALGANNAGGWTIGAGPGGGGPVKALYGELILVTGTLSAANLALAQAYLNGRWNCY